MYFPIVEREMYEAWRWGTADEVSNYTGKPHLAQFHNDQQGIELPLAAGLAPRRRPLPYLISSTLFFVVFHSHFTLIDSTEERLEQFIR